MNNHRLCQAKMSHPDRIGVAFFIGKILHKPMALFQERRSFKKCGCDGERPTLIQKRRGLFNFYYTDTDVGKPSKERVVLTTQNPPESPFSKGGIKSVPFFGI